MKLCIILGLVLLTSCQNITTNDQKKNADTPKIKKHITTDNSIDIINNSIHAFYLASSQFGSLMYDHSQTDQASLTFDCKLSGTKTFILESYNFNSNGEDGEFGKADVKYDNCKNTNSMSISGTITGTVAHIEGQSTSTFKGTITLDSYGNITELEKINYTRIMEYNNKNTRTHSFQFDISNTNLEKITEQYTIKTSPNIKSVQFKLDSGGIEVKALDNNTYVWKVTSNQMISKDMFPINIIKSKWVL
ncbi:MAG: hypothetical protein MJK11_11100 [Pseudomonadales bacterium]|nr:hypothetical protein [Pseudomonadales bacterium]